MSRVRLALRSLISAAPIYLLAAACVPSPPANPTFSDAIQFAFREFDAEDPAILAFAVRDLEEQLYTAMDLEASSLVDRSLRPAELTAEDTEGITAPDRDPSLCLPVAMGGVSAFGPEEHAPYLLLADQTPVEPGSPDLYDRTFVDDTDSCWADRSCEFLRTDNDLIKENILLTIHYRLLKDYRWVDLNLPDPMSVPEGETVVNDGPKRWGIVARSWTEERAVGEQGTNVIEQSFTVEVWIPRDGGGYIRADGDENEGDGEWTADSTGGGSLRMMTLWAETNIDADEATIEGTTRFGIDQILDAQEEWLAEE